MTKVKLRAIALGISAAMLGGISQSTWAHPGWQTSVSVGGRSTATGSATKSPYTSQFNAITVGHGCSQGAGSGYKGVRAASWIMPQGTTPSETAPFSTNCSPAGDNCQDVEGQFSVAKFMNNSEGATTDPTSGITTFPKSLRATVMTTLQDEFVGVSTLANRFKLNQNKGVFSTQNLKLSDTNFPIGFWEKNGYVDPNAIAVTDIRMTTGGLEFKPGTCATQIIVRMAGADICKIDRKLTNEHNQNLWFGGPTNIMTTGHGVHENFWLAYTVTRPASETASCSDADKYSIVVMPTDREINNLSFRGWATR
jgi:hypothetical protein